MAAPPSIQPEAAGADQAPGRRLERAARRCRQPLAIGVAEEHPLRIVRQDEAVGRGRERASCTGLTR